MLSPDRMRKAGPEPERPKERRLFFDMKEKNIPSPCELLKLFVSIDTRNPPGNEKRFASEIRTILKPFGVDAEIRDLGSNRANLIVRLRASHPERPPIVLNGHMDTVPTSEGWTGDPLILVRSGHRLIGRGTADMKGSLACQLHVLMKQSLNPEKLRQDVFLVWTAGEETDCLGSRAVCERTDIPELTAIIIGEPSGNRIVTAQKGALWLRISTKGSASHGAYPERGVNAIESCVRAVSAVKNALRSETHPLLGALTINWGGISGGRSPNIVPDSAEAVLDIRYPPLITDAHLFREVESAVRSVGNESEIRVEVLNHRRAFETKPENGFVREALHLVGQSVPMGIRAYTDGSVFAGRFDCPIIIIGPGSMDQAHTADEYIDEEELTNAVSIYSRFLEKPCFHKE